MSRIARTGTALVVFWLLLLISPSHAHKGHPQKYTQEMRKQKVVFKQKYTFAGDTFNLRSQQVYPSPEYGKHSVYLRWPRKILCFMTSRSVNIRWSIQHLPMNISMSSEARATHSFMTRKAKRKAGRSWNGRKERFICCRRASFIKSSTGPISPAGFSCGSNEINLGAPAVGCRVTADPARCLLILSEEL